MVRAAEKELENRNWESCTPRFMSSKVSASGCVHRGPVKQGGSGCRKTRAAQSRHQLSVRFPSLTYTLFVLGPALA